MVKILKYTKYILIVFFRGLFTISIAGKIIDPIAFRSFMISLYKKSSLFLKMNGHLVSDIIILFYLCTILIEVFIIYTSLFHKEIFIYANLFYCMILFFIMFFMKINHIDTDCGCFGSIVTIRASIMFYIDFSISILSFILVIIELTGKIIIQEPSKIYR